MGANTWCPLPQTPNLRTQHFCAFFSQKNNICKNIRMTNLPQELNKLNFSLITIRFHPTDMESFDFFYKSIFLPNFVFKCPI